MRHQSKLLSFRKHDRIWHLRADRNCDPWSCRTGHFYLLSYCRHYSIPERPLLCRAWIKNSKGCIGDFLVLRSVYRFYNMRPCDSRRVRPTHTPTSPVGNFWRLSSAGLSFWSTYCRLPAWLVAGVLQSMPCLKNGSVMEPCRFSAGTCLLFITFLPTHSFPENDFLGQYPDFLGMATVIALGLLLSCGAKLSARVNSVVTILNLLVIVMATILMFCLTNPDSRGSALDSHGGFLPFGFGGVIAGAGTCFYAFIGFDAITVSGEEALNPQRSVPIATAVSVSLVTVIFVMATSSLTLFVPWWTVDRQTAFTAAMRARDINWAVYVTGIGSLLGIAASLFTSLYAMPRIVYAMASDRLLPEWMGYVLPSTRVRCISIISIWNGNETKSILLKQVPVVAMGLFGGLAATLTFLCDIHTLAEFLSIGTLIAYTIVCMNVCILRYCDVSSLSEGETEPKSFEDVSISIIYHRPC